MSAETSRLIAASFEPAADNNPTSSRRSERTAHDESAAFAKLPEPKRRSIDQDVARPSYRGEGERDFGRKAKHVSEDEEAAFLNPEGARHQKGARARGLDERCHHDCVAHTD